MLWTGVHINNVFIFNAIIVSDKFYQFFMSFSPTRSHDLLRAITSSLLIVTCLVSSAPAALASSTSNFTQTINPGTLSVDIVDASYVTVGSPSVAMGATSFSFSCQTATGTFGTTTQQIYVNNPDAADNGWTVSIAASAATAVWDSAGTDFDFNDATGSGCTDGGGDADSLGGQLTVNPAVGTIATGACSSCTTTNVSLGSSAAFAEGTTNTITILTGASGSNDIGDWTLQGVSLSQKVPAEQPAASDYDINMVVSIVAS